MIAADTSALVNFYNDKNVHPALESAINDNLIVLPCVVMSEILSTPGLPKPIAKNVISFPTLYPQDDQYWTRVANLRQKALTNKKKARLADTLIAQLCLDFAVPLITQDKDFQKLAQFCKLTLL